MLPVRAVRNGLDDVFPSTLRSLGRDLDTLFGNVFDSPQQAAPFHVDIREDQDGLVIEADLPGISNDQLDITVEENVLTISGQTKVENEEKSENYHVRERRWGKFARSFRLPGYADGENVAADLKNGVLTLRVPKRAEAKPRKIQVK